MKTLLATIAAAIVGVVFAALYILACLFDRRNAGNGEDGGDLWDT